MSNNNPGCLGFIFKLLGLSPKEEFKESVILPYSKRDDFLSNAELSFYKILQQYIGERAIICPKVSLQDIFFVNVSNQSQRSTYNNKISRKHVDFLLCSNETVQPICGIELDDRSHQRADRIERDKFVEKVYETASLPLVRFQNKQSYTMNEIKEKLDYVLDDYKRKEYQEDQKISVDISNSTAPKCKKCGAQMVKREAKKGDNKGKVFYGCPNYPKCREIVHINQ